MVLRSGKRKVQASRTTPLPPRKKARKVTKLDNTKAKESIPDPAWQDKACSICMEDKPLADYPTATELPATCQQHCLMICRTCIRASLAVDIAEKPLDRVGCPDCNESWNHWTVQTHASPESFATYDALQLLQVLEAMPDYRPCLQSNCKGGQIHAEGEACPIVTCKDCGSKSCYTHRVPWHGPMTCEFYERLQETDEETKRRVAAEEEETRKGAENIKFCPNCHLAVEKTGGCDHMRCKCTNPQPMNSRR